MATKIGRNQDCPCGSGKKHKFCCGGNGELEHPKQPKMLTQRGLNKCFLKIVKDAGGFLEMACADLDAMPKDEFLGIKHHIEGDMFHFEVVKVKKSPIIQPDERIRLARN